MANAMWSFFNSFCLLVPVPWLSLPIRPRFTPPRWFVNLSARIAATHLRLFFFPTHSPELNPDEQVWNELTPRQLGKQPIKHKADLKKRIRSILKSLQHKAEKVRSFFQLPDTKYAAIPQAII